MNIELTALEAGSLVIFTVSIVGIVMALKRRARRNKQKNVKQDVEEYEFKSNPETLAPERVRKETESEPDEEHGKPKHDVDALLRDLKNETETD